MTSSTRSDFSGSIRVEKLGKLYPMKHAAGSGALKFNELVTSQITRCFSFGQWRAKPGYFTALEDVSFEIGRGELVGLVGKNGSGKSTLLKLLAKVTKPTSGRAWLRGRVGSLLEVGTGFHPELTGYENVYLSGTILGMSRAEIARNFDEIVAFSEVGQFLNIPVKRLSSGMAMRLAFSVAAHLSPDILLVDEALSVGDAGFQKKCLAKLRQFVDSGVTVIFVTHDLSLLNKWCKRVLLLDHGRLIEDGPALSILPKYLETAGPAAGYRLQLEENPLAEKTGLSFREVVVNEGEPVRHGQPFRIDVTFRTLMPQPRLSFGLALTNLDGTRLVACDSDLPGGTISLEAERAYVVSIAMRRFDLGAGSYLLDLVFRREDGSSLDERPACMRIEVFPAQEGETDGEAMARRNDITTRPVFDWTLSPSHVVV